MFRAKNVLVEIPPDQRSMALRPTLVVDSCIDGMWSLEEFAQPYMAIWYIVMLLGLCPQY